MASRTLEALYGRAQKNLFLHMVSGLGLGLQFSYEKYGFKTMVFYREHLPGKNMGLKPCFFRDFLKRPLRAVISALRAL